MVAADLETARLRLEPWRARHTELLVELSSIPQVMSFIGHGDVWSRDRAEGVAAAARRHWDDHRFGWRAATEKPRGARVGFIALNFAGEGTTGLDVSEYEIGWWLTPEAWGRGLAREGAAAVRDEALETLHAPSVVARIQPANARSIAVAESLGLSLDVTTTGTTGEAVAVYRLDAPAASGTRARS